MNAIASQLSNFLKWQLEADIGDLAAVRVVGVPDDKTRDALQNRLLEKLGSPSLPQHMTSTCESLEECIANEQNCGDDDACDKSKETAVYLSPDAEDSLDPSKRPPRIAVVGLLIDRRVQPNRSKDRASKLNIVAKRWPLDDCFADISAKEPLNVDCVLEGMQQWWWNCDEAAGDKTDRECFVKAASQAIEHHAKRHPSRPLHLSTS